MATDTNPNPQAASAPDSPAGMLTTCVITSSLAEPEILSRLDALARRGKLAGFERGTPGGPLFTLEAPGAPFDYVLEAWRAPAPGPTRLELRMRLLKRMPLIFAVVLALTVWPGVWLTHSMCRAYFSFYTYPEWVTWAWYIPLTVLPLPWALVRMMRGSRIAAHASANESIEALQRTLAAAADRA